MCTRRPLVLSPELLWRQVTFPSRAVVQRIWLSTECLGLWNINAFSDIYHVYDLHNIQIVCMNLHWAFDGTGEGETCTDACPHNYTAMELFVTLKCLPTFAWISTTTQCTKPQEAAINLDIQTSNSIFSNGLDALKPWCHQLSICAGVVQG